MARPRAKRHRACPAALSSRAASRPSPGRICWAKPSRGPYPASANASAACRRILPARSSQRTRIRPNSSSSRAKAGARELRRSASRAASPRGSRSFFPRIWSSPRRAAKERARPFFFERGRGERVQQIVEFFNARLATVLRTRKQFRWPNELPAIRWPAESWLAAKAPWLTQSAFAKLRRDSRRLSGLEVRGFEPLAFSLRTRRSTN